MFTKKLDTEVAVLPRWPLPLLLIGELTPAGDFVVADLNQLLVLIIVLQLVEGHVGVYDSEICFSALMPQEHFSNTHKRMFTLCHYASSPFHLPSTRPSIFELHMQLYYSDTNTCLKLL